MKHKRLVVVAIVGAAVVAGFVGWLYYMADNPASNVDASTPQVIRGRITAISNQCQSDGTCSVTLDSSKLIVTGCGLGANGRTCKGYDQSKLHAGQLVEATVTKGQSGWYDLECDSCTIRVIDE